MIYQQTLKSKTTVSGIGLHSGKTITLTLRPAQPGTGIVFHRVDLSPAVSIEAAAKNVVNTRLSTTIGKDGASVSTIEHLMAALYGCGIDNAHVDIDGPEVPIMDGSADPMVAAIRRAGIETSSKLRRFLVVKKAVTVTVGDKRVTVTPSRDFKISFDMQFEHPVVKRQFRTLTVSPEQFEEEVAAARTFCFLAEVEMMKSHGLALGGSLENAVVIGDDGVLNPEGLRYQDEFVRHKILDSVGDFYLCGHRMLGHVKALKSGHDLNHKVVTELLSRPDCFALVEFPQPEAATPFTLPLPELAWAEVA